MQKASTKEAPMPIVIKIITSVFVWKKISEKIDNVKRENVKITGSLQNNAVKEVENIIIRKSAIIKTTSFTYTTNYKYPLLK